MKRFMLGIVAAMAILAVPASASAKTIAACENTTTHTVRVAPPKCHSGELHVRLTPFIPYIVVGKTGPAGAQGLPGIPGVAGSIGLVGQQGIQGALGAEGPAGKSEKGATGPQGPQGAAGDSYLSAAYYSVAYYNVGDTNGGAIATVACEHETDTAISGGASVDDYTKDVPIGQSFPGRMDWSTNTPKPERLDGWIVQFASQNGSAPEKVKVWALCVPSLKIPVRTTYTESE